jgi:hypothetical protein
MVGMKEADIHKTSFVIPQGQYEWIVMPFGLKNAPGVFQRKMDNIFKPFIDFCIVYVDDILVFSKTKEEHCRSLWVIVSEMVERGIILSERKIKLFKDKIEFLGLEFDHGKVVLQNHISERAQSFPDELEDRAMVERFLGLVNYASDYIEKLSYYRKLLQELLKKRATWNWTSNCTEAVKALKSKCCNFPAMSLPEPGDDLILETDASRACWAGVLKKRVNGLEEVCGHVSSTFKKFELNYDINEKEYLAVVRRFQKFKHFLLPQMFTVRSDNTQVYAFIRNKVDDYIGK